LRPVPSRSGLRQFLHFFNSPAVGGRFKTGIAVQSENCAYTADAIKVCLCLIWDALAMLLAGAFPGVTWHGFRHTLEQAVSPASYPTSPTRR
jgi:hypothetical protein